VAPLTEVVSRGGHRDRRQPEPDPLHEAAGDQHRQAARGARDDAAGGDDDQRAEHRPTPVPPVPEPTEDRRRERPSDQRRGQRPLRARQRDPEVGSDVRQERRAEAADDRDDQRDADQHRHEGGANGSGMGGAVRQGTEKYIGKLCICQVGP
jgi:hypothetical protein